MVTVAWSSVVCVVCVVCLLPLFSVVRCGLIQSELVGEIPVMSEAESGYSVYQDRTITGLFCFYSSYVLVFWPARRLALQPMAR